MNIKLVAIISSIFSPITILSIPMLVSRSRLPGSSDFGDQNIKIVLPSCYYSDCDGRNFKSYEQTE